jgi:hypothetical protein
MAEELLVLDALGGGTLAPKAKARGLERFSHVGNYLTFGEAGYFTDFLKGNPVGPGSPNDPVRTIFGWFRFFYPGNWTVGLLGIHIEMI